jgi:hypothetical protein
LGSRGRSAWSSFNFLNFISKILIEIPWFNWQSSDVFEGVSNNKRNSGCNGKTSGKGKTNNVLGSCLEFSKETSGVNIDDGFGKDATLVIDCFDFHTIFKGFEVKLFEESCFWSFHFFVFSADLEIFGDLDLTLNNLSWDVQGMEEVNLWGVKSGRSSRYTEVNRGNNTDSSFSWDFVSLNLSSKLMNWGISEDQCYFLLK